MNATVSLSPRNDSNIISDPVTNSTQTINSPIPLITSKSNQTITSSISPASSKHPFWSAPTGSSLVLFLDHNSPRLSMTITVHTMSRPYVYQMIVRQTGFDPTTVYHKKREALKLIKNEWMQYYSERTIVQYNEHRSLDSKELPNIDGINTVSPRSNTVSPRSNTVSPRSNTVSPRSNTVSPRSGSGHLSNGSKPISPRTPVFSLLSPRSVSGKGPVDSCPPTPSPRTLRKNSLKSRLGLGLKKNSPREGSDSSTDNSPRSNNDSPRSPGWFRRRLSLPLKKSPRSSESSPRTPRLDTDSDNSPRSPTIQPSPRTYRLLRRASLQLASKSPRHRTAASNIQISLGETDDIDVDDTDIEDSLP